VTKEKKKKGKRDKKRGGGEKELRKRDRKESKHPRCVHKEQNGIRLIKTKRKSDCRRNAREDGNDD